MNPLPARSLPRLALAGAGLLLSATGAWAQATDDCASAPNILGYGTYAFSNQGATTDGPPACGSHGSDVWYRWTATVTEGVEISTCGLVNYDSALVVYGGDCGSFAPQLACNDDACGLSSAVTFAATAGDTYLVRIGGFSGNQGSGAIQVAQGSVSSGCDDPARGPDVIVGALTGPSSYGASNGVSAFSIGTTSCNVGDAELDWIAGNPNHPVIGQNIYRYMDGRFEQLGISWLKHGFTALQGNLCCDCISSGTGSRLGVGCSDPYGSSLNGSQSGLGPRFEVNAATGAFLYPYTGQGQTGNNVFKRCQVPNADLDPALNPGAVYYGEGQYVTPDDAAWGNQANNASHRRMTVGAPQGGGWSMDFVGTTQREEPAIRAWPDQDPTVILSDVMVPNDGLFIVGSGVTDNGDGTWDYEYAVHNLYSDRSGGSFSVPVPPTATVTNIGFHDVDYHSGEPYDGTDWTASLLPDRIEWATETHAVNPMANALRWGTLYNFRFTADVPPTRLGQVTVGLFKPGGVASVDGGAWAPLGADLGEPFCSPAVPHSGGVPARIVVAGSSAVTDNDVTLLAVDLPQDQFGYFLASTVQQLQPGYLGSTGTLCLGLPMARFTGQVGFGRTLGAITASVDTSAMPMNFLTAIQPGETWTFQAWYRDGDTSNFTDAKAVDFQ